MYKILSYALIILMWGCISEADINKAEDYYFSGDYDKALIEYKSVNTDPKAQYRLGLMYENGQGVQTDKKKALKWLTLSADQGYVQAQLEIGFINYNKGNDKSFKKALNWWNLAAKQGSARGQFFIGAMYEEGLGIGKNSQKAFENYKLAANQNLVQAQVKVGNYYWLDLNDYVNAKKWLMMAAKAGNIQAQINLGALLCDLADYNLAEMWLLKAFEVLEKDNGTHEYSTQIYANLGRLYFEKSNYKLAEEMYLKTLFISEKTEPESFDIARTTNALGAIYGRIGLYSKAIDFHNRSIAVLDNLRLKNKKNYNPDLYTANLNNLSNAYNSLKNNRLAFKNLKKAEVIIKETFGENSQKLAPILSGIGLTYLLERNFDLAESYYLKSLELNKKNLGFFHDDVARNYAQLGSLNLEQKKFSLANDYYLKSLEIKERTLDRDHAETALQLDQLSQLHFENLNYSKALFYKEAQIEIMDRRILISKLDLKSGEDFLIKSAYSNYIAQLMQYNKDNLNSESLAKIFEASQKSKISVTSKALEQMAIRYLPKSEGLTELIRQEQDLNKQYFAEKDLLLNNLAENKDSTEDEISSQLNKIINTEKKIKKISSEISNLFPKYSELTNSIPLSISDTQNLLLKKEGLFSIILDKETDTVYGFLIGKNKSKAYKIKLRQEELSEIIKKLRTGVDITKSTDFKTLPKYDLDLSYNLYMKLFGPIQDLLINLDSLIIIPSGPLESIPFNLLITEKPRTYKNDFKSYQNAAWFLKTHNLTRLPSIKSLKSLRSEKTLKNTNNIFIGFGNPSLRAQDNTVQVISLNDIFRGKNTDIETLRGLPELPQTFIELNQIAEYLDTSKDDLYLKDRATETNVKSIDLSKASIISFATHGLIAGDLNELVEPALVLTPPKTASEFDDGLLTASEIMLLKLNANWVLLSACNTAAGETLNAEGLSGLARAFIYAGTQSLLVSHWKIESNAATKITTGIFDIIQEYPNIKNSEALRRSLLRLLKNNENPHYAHPAFWAPFSLVGDGLSI